MPHPTGTLGTLAARPGCVEVRSGRVLTLTSIAQSREGGLGEGQPEDGQCKARHCLPDPPEHSAAPMSPGVPCWPRSTALGSGQVWSSQHLSLHSTHEIHPCCVSSLDSHAHLGAGWALLSLCPSPSLPRPTPTCSGSLLNEHVKGGHLPPPPLRPPEKKFTQYDQTPF